jgi:hypothetical protein
MKLKYANGKRVTKAQEFEFFRQIKIFEIVSDALANVDRDENGRVLLWSAVNCMRAVNVKFETICKDTADWLRDESIPAHPAIVDVDDN